MRPNSALSSSVRSFTLTAILCAVFARAEEEKKPETNVAVSVGKIVRTTLHAYITGYGTVETAPARGADQPAGGARLAAGASGLVVAVPGIEGARVAAGAVLVQLDGRGADAAVLRAQAAVTLAEKTRARQTLLQAADGTSERASQEADERLASARGELAAAQLLQSQFAIRAPIAGTISRLRARPGEWLEAGKDVAEIVDLDRLVVAAQVPSAEAAALHAGQTAGVFAQLGVAEKPLAEGTVLFVSPQVTPENDSVLVRVGVPAGATLRPGQLVVVRVASSEKAGILAVPVESLVKEADSGHVISLVENGVAKQKAVQPGLRDRGLVEVSGEGLAEGAVVVTTGAYGLPKETKVTVRQP